MTAKLAHINLTAVLDNPSDQFAPPGVVGGEAPSTVHDTCTTCFGTGMEVVPGKGARRCRCREQDQRARLLAATRIPRRYRECTLQNYRPEKGNGSQLRAFNNAYRLVTEYPAADRGLLFAGTVGEGKTHLAAGTLRQLTKKGVSCVVYAFRALFN